MLILIALYVTSIALYASPTIHKDILEVVAKEQGISDSLIAQQQPKISTKLQADNSLQSAT
jgi:hypothetical protein